MEGKMSYGGSVATMPLAPGYAPRAFPIVRGLCRPRPDNIQPYYAPVRPGVQLQPAPSALLPLLVRAQQPSRLIHACGSR